MSNAFVIPQKSALKLNHTQRSLSPTWSSLLVCRSRCLKKSRREHFLTRMRSVVPSARWAEGDRPLGLRGHAQLMLAALMAMNFPRITLQPPLPSDTATHTHTHTHTFYLVVRVYIKKRKIRGSILAQSLHPNGYFMIKYSKTLSVHVWV